MNEYALYRGDELLIVGTIEEISKFRGCKKNTLYRRNCPSIVNNFKTDNHLVLIKLEEDEEE